MDAAEFANVKLIVGVAKDGGSVYLANRKSLRDSPKTESEFLDACAATRESLPVYFETKFRDPGVSKRIISRYYKQCSTPSECVTSFITDAGFICPAYDFVENYARRNRSVYMYFFKKPFRKPLYGLDVERFGAFHGIPFANFMGVLLDESFLSAEDTQ